MIIEKTYRVEYAHRLAKHSGACRNLHGHCGVVTVRLEGTVDKESGMVIDFGALNWLRDIVMKFDHATALDSKDSLYRILETAINSGELSIDLIAMDGPPTAENFCSYLAEKIQDYICSCSSTVINALRLTSISFQETLGNKAIQEFI